VQHKLRASLGSLDSDIGGNTALCYYRSRSISWVLFSLVLVCGAINIFDDEIIYSLPYMQTIEEYSYLHQTFSSILIGLIAIIGVFKLLKYGSILRCGQFAKLFLIFYFLSVALGTIVGAVKGNPWAYILGDARNAIVYLSLFAITDVNEKDFEKKLYGLFNAVCIIVLIKVFVAFAVFAVVLSTISIDARLLLKMSYYLMSMAVLSLAMMAKGKHRKYFFMFILCMVGTFLTQTRGLFLGLIAGIITLYAIFALKKRARQLFPPLIIAGTLAFLTAFLVFSDPTASFGRWKGEQFEGSLSVRVSQQEGFLKIFTDNPIFGIGLGGVYIERFNPDIRRPYLQELEYHNLLAKLGIVGSILMMSAFGFLLKECWYCIRRAPTRDKSGMIAGLLAGLVALLVSGITNPVFSSVYFHLYVVILLLSLSAIRMSIVSVRLANISESMKVA